MLFKNFHTFIYILTEIYTSYASSIFVMMQIASQKHAKQAKYLSE